VELLFFFLFAVLAVASAIMVVTFRDPVHSVVALMVCFFQVACLFVLLRSPFLAGAQLFVYVGAIMVFFVFAVFLLDIRRSMEKPRFTRWAAGAVSLGVLMVAEVLLLVLKGSFGKAPAQDEAVSSMLSMGQSAEALGAVLYTKFLYPFEIISVVLLVAFIGAVVLTVKQIKES